VPTGRNLFSSSIFTKKYTKISFLFLFVVWSNFQSTSRNEFFLWKKKLKKHTNILQISFHFKMKISIFYFPKYFKLYFLSLSLTYFSSQRELLQDKSTYASIPFIICVYFFLSDLCVDIVIRTVKLHEAELRGAVFRRSALQIPPLCLDTAPPELRPPPFFDKKDVRVAVSSAPLRGGRSPGTRQSRSGADGWTT
jgi:hypothetical protein